MSATEIIIPLLIESASVICIVVMWQHHRPERLRKDVIWTLLLAIPIFGPLMWGAFYGGLPRRNRPRPDGSAGGWSPHRKNL